MQSYVLNIFKKSNFLVCDLHSTVHVCCSSECLAILLDVPSLQKEKHVVSVEHVQQMERSWKRRSIYFNECQYRSLSIRVHLITTTNCNCDSGLKQWPSVDKNADSKVHSTATTNCNVGSGLQQCTGVEQYVFAILKIFTALLIYIPYNHQLYS